MKSTKCDKCDTEIRNCNYKKHIDVCTGNYIRWIKSAECKWCNLPFDANVNIPNHVRWCLQNPISEIHRKELAERTIAGNFVVSDEIKAQHIASIRKAHTDGKYRKSQEKRKGKPGTKKTDEQKAAARIKALASPHRRLVRSIRKYVKKDGSLVMLDSSWEEALALRLDNENINWIRPGPIRWVDKENVYHNYFPDFYLEDYDIFLDPKNPQAVKVQKSKLECLTEQIKNLIIITSLEDCKTFTI